MCDPCCAPCCSPCGPCGPCGPCPPCGPCSPCDPCCAPFECSPKCYTGAQLDAVPQCAPRIAPPHPKCITVQQPPRLICKKRVVFTEKVVPEPMVVNRCRQITIPKVVDTTRVIKVPKLTWVSQMVREPRVIYYPSMIPDPYVVCYPKRICEPREVCQSILCQPKPQTVDIPPPREYCCYPTGPINYKPSAACPPCPMGGFHLETIHLGLPERQSGADVNRWIPFIHRKLINSFLLFLQPKACRSRELRCGIMYTTCECIKRNGLQDKCPRSLCQGRSACMCFPTPNCCPSSFPLRYANMTMGVIKKKNKDRRTGGGGNCCSCTCDPCSPSSDPAYCGLSNPQCGAPSPIPCSPTPRCCPPLPEGGIPDPRIWNSCNTPQIYPCPPCPCPWLLIVGLTFSTAAGCVGGLTETKLIIDDQIPENCSIEGYLCEATITQKKILGSTLSDLLKAHNELLLLFVMEAKSAVCRDIVDRDKDKDMNTWFLIMRPANGKLKSFCEISIDAAPWYGLFYEL
uniref:IGFBP N-terminal domain-containing protein n=1 Tax=Glossina brevipalpis TaxID=37001 RepID=A0A1A9X280_9MUSC